MALELEIAKVGTQIFNDGSNRGNRMKEELISMIGNHVQRVKIEYKNLTFGEDMGGIKVSFDQIERVLGYNEEVNVEEGIRKLA